MDFLDILAIYGVVALTHLFVQLNLAHIDYLRSLKDKFDPNFAPSAVIIIPTFKEDYLPLENTIIAALSQKYKGELKVLLVDDGSEDQKTMNELRRKFQSEISSGRLYIEEFEKNKGKRHAQKHGFDLFKDLEVAVTIDSDTILKNDAVANLVQKFKNPRVGAVTGDVRVINKKKLLAKLIDNRYWAAFNQERAAQSLFGTVLCCSGPLSAYRINLINEVKEKYISQKFLGEFCTYGDDRHLTNLILEKGYEAKFERRAKAKTEVPTSIKKWLKQQARWNRSFYREILWTAKIIMKNPRALHPYIIYDLAVQTILPILLLLSLAYMSYRAYFFGLVYLWGYLAVLGAIAFCRSIYAIIRTRDTSFIIFPIYAVLHVFLLVPLRFFSLLTMKTTKWGTR